MASDSPVLRDDHGRKIFIGSPEPGTVTANITCGMTSVLASLSGERLDAVREAIDRAAMQGQPGEAPAPSLGLPYAQGWDFRPRDGFSPCLLPSGHGICGHEPPPVFCGEPEHHEARERAEEAPGTDGAS